MTHEHFDVTDKKLILSRNSTHTFVHVCNCASIDVISNTNNYITTAVDHTALIHCISFAYLELFEESTSVEVGQSCGQHPVGGALTTHRLTNDHETMTNKHHLIDLEKINK